MTGATTMPERPSRARFATAAIAATAIILGGFLVGSAFGPETAGWYFRIEKPWITPPVWVFPLAWTTLYLLMGVALARVLHAPEGPARRGALRLFAVQLALNYGWSAVFFGLQALGPATVAAAALGLATAAAAVAMGRVDRLAGALMAPTVAWVAFATLLTGWIWRLNG